MYCLHLFYHLNVTMLQSYNVTMQKQFNVRHSVQDTYAVRKENCYSQPKCILSLPNAIARQHFKEKSIHFST
jgi:hypothetical protein